MAVAAILTPDYVSPEEYLRREEKALEKSEYIAGEIRAMAGGSLNHSQLITNLTRLFGNATQGRICRYLGSETKVLIGKGPRYFYPDGTISCPPNAVNRRSGVIDNPKVVFEVLSPGTEDYDRGEKFFAYASAASVQQIVLVSSQRRRVDVWTRVQDGWHPDEVLEGVLTLASVEIRITLDELYEHVSFESDET